MYVLQTNAILSTEKREALRLEFRERTGQDCLILDCGLKLEKVRIKREQPLWRRLFRID